MANAEAKNGTIKFDAFDKFDALDVFGKNKYVMGDSPLGQQLLAQEEAKKEFEDAINVNGNDLLQYSEELQKAQWEREDMIRQETQEREDTAWQRAVADMRAAGINPNIVNASAAASGGGITSATPIDTSLANNEMDLAWQKLQTYIDNNFTAGENEKDRLTQLITSWARTYAAASMLKK